MSLSMTRKTAAGAASRPLATNRAASHEYHLLRRIEAGLVLTGTEVKSARAGRVNLKDAYARIVGGEVFLLDAHFSPYDPGARSNVDPLRVRKLLLHASEIRRLAKDLSAAGTTIVPTQLYLKNGRIKVELALATGKRQHDKRDAARERELDREIARAQRARAT
jgi:SsrA-binding protein